MILLTAENPAATWYASTLAEYGKPILAYKSFLLRGDFESNATNIQRPLVNAWAPDTASIFMAALNGRYINLKNTINREIDYVAIIKPLISQQVRITADVFYATGDTAFYPLTSWINLTDTVNLICFKQNYRVPGNPSLFLPMTAPNIRIEVAGSGTNLSSVAHIRMGRYLRLQRGNFIGLAPSDLSEQVERVNQISESGQYLGSFTKRAWRTAKIDQQHNTEQFVYENVRPFIEHVNALGFASTAPSTFLYAPRPEQTTGAGTAAKNVIYGWAKNEIVPQYTHGCKYMSWGCDVEAIL